MKPPTRAGFSLMEVLVATAILMGSMVALSQLAFVGRRHAESAGDLATAQLLCESKLNEIMASAAPVVAVEEEEIAGWPDWVCSVTIEPVQEPATGLGLAAVCVTVTEKVEEGQSQGRTFSLVRWIPDPDAPDADAPNADATGRGGGANPGSSGSALLERRRRSGGGGGPGG